MAVVPEVTSTRRRLTERLRLEPVSPGNAADLWLVHQDPHIAHWYAGTWSEAAARERAELMALQWSRDGVGKWLAYREDGALVGRGGLSRTVLDGQDCLELGWAVRTPYRGQGYATEIGRAGLRSAFQELGAADVVSFTEVHNLASRAVMERLGMRYVRQLRRPGLVAGMAGVQDDAAFALYGTARS